MGMYLKLRLLPGIQKLEERRSILEWIETINYVIGGMAVVATLVLCLLKIMFFATPSMIVTSFVWTPILVIFACILEAMMRFEQVDARIRATTEALSSLRSVHMWWTSQ